MKLYLVRHGDALDPTVDPQRGLSSSGRANIAAIADLLKKAGVRPTEIEHSGKQRALQTAEIFAASLGVTRCRARSGIAPGDSVGPFVEELATLSHEKMVVGHLPFVGAALSALLVGQGDTHVAAAFETGATACLERFGVGSWALRWMLVPDLLCQHP